MIPVQRGEEGYEGSVWDENVPGRARLATLEIFATDNSASVQVRLFLFLNVIIFSKLLCL